VNLRGDALVAELRRAHRKAVVDDCHDKCCKLDLQGLPQRVILKGERLEALLPDHLRASLDRDKMADRIALVPDGEWVHVVVVELKKGRFDVARAMLQVRNGMAVAEQILRKARADLAYVEPYAFIAHGPGVHREDAERVRSERLPFATRNVELQPRNCGERLLAILRREAPSYTPLGSGKATSREQ